MVYGVANKVRLGIDVIKEVSMIIKYFGKLVNKVMYTCLQLHGGTGYTDGTEIERTYTRCKSPVDRRRCHRGYVGRGR